MSVSLSCFLATVWVFECKSEYQVVCRMLHMLVISHYVCMCAVGSCMNGDECRGFVCYWIKTSKNEVGYDIMYVVNMKVKC